MLESPSQLWEERLQDFATPIVLRRIKFEVIKKFKGKIKKSTVYIYADNSCHYNFKVGKQHILYPFEIKYQNIDNRRKYLFVDVCELSAEIDVCELKYFFKRE